MVKFWGAMKKEQTDKIYIVGIGDNGADNLGKETLSIIQDAEILFGGERHLEFFQSHTAEKVIVKSNLKEVAAQINLELGKKRMVVLASGDPLFYGIGKYILSKVEHDKEEILPFTSSMQLAFAKIKESWEDAHLVSLHAKPLENLLNLIKASEPKKIGIFTDDKNSPDHIARTLIEKELNGYQSYVCENLGSGDEKIISGNLEDIAQGKFSSLNVMILIKREKQYAPKDEKSENNRKWSFGIPDDEFYQRTPEKGLITKSEIRVISLAKMKLQPDSIVWDIGAGSGSVSIESALLAPSGKVYAVEKNEEDYKLILKNIEKFKTSHIEAIHGLAPNALASIPLDPDAVFIGGSSGNMHEILKVCSERLKPNGRIIVNVITLENLSEAWESLKKIGLNSEVTLLQISRSQPILEITRFAALNPIFIITAKK